MAESNTHSNNIEALESAQEVETDNRQKAREADDFLNKRDGQWEPKIISKWSQRPRYTFDECNPIVDDIMGEMEAMDFNIRVTPAGGDASKQTAQQFEGVIRHIENISKARFIYNDAGRIMVGTGLAAWRIVQEYQDGDSFQQDLLIKSIPNVQDTVWFDENAVKQDMSDAEECWVLTSMSKKAYKAEYPKGSGMSIGDDRDSNSYAHKKEEILIGEYMWRKRKVRELALLSNNQVVVVDDEFNAVKDDYKAKGIEIVQQREREFYQVYHRVLDGADWLSDEKETVFSYIPVIPVYGNFRISEGKVIYWGVTEKLMDAQRIINYSESRKIDEGALSPKGKYWMTKEQAVSPDVKNSLTTLNTNNDPVQFYDFEEGQPPPQYQGSPASNPGLMETTQSAQNFVQRTSGTFDESRGTAPAQRSGTAIDKLQTKSDNPKRKWFTSMEKGLSHTCTILVKAIPKVYDTRQLMPLLNPDGTTDAIMLKDKVVDGQTGRSYEINDLSKGKYNATCSSGPAFHSRQQETVTAIQELAQIDPSIIQIGADVLLNNIASPGIDKIAERKRMMMVAQGMIPPTQQTEAEKQMVAQQQQQQQGKMSPLDQANMMIAQAQLQETQGKNEERAMKMQLEQQKLQLKNMELQLKVEADRNKLILDANESILNQINNQADTLKLLKEAIGADTIVSKHAMSAYQGQAENLDEVINRQ